MSNLKSIYIVVWNFKNLFGFMLSGYAIYKWIDIK